MGEAASAFWQTDYTVQSFVADRRNLKAEPARQAAGKAAALRLAERLAESKAGVVVISCRCAPELNEYDQPQVVDTFGRVPDRLDELLAA